MRTAALVLVLAACPTSAPTAAPAPGPTFATTDVTVQSVIDALAAVRSTAGDLANAAVTIELRSGVPALVVQPTSGRPEISHPFVRESTWPGAGSGQTPPRVAVHDGLMALFEQHPQARWIVPATVIALVGAGTTFSSAQADTGLAPKTAEQLLVALQQAKVETYSGTVAAKVDLGLGGLSGLGSRTTSFQNLADGSSTLRVWASGPDKQRVALVGEAGEADVIRNGRTVWTWNAQDRTATQSILPAEPTAAEKAAHQASAEAKLTPSQRVARAKAEAQLPKTPQDAARLALSKIDPTTRVTTNGYATVAGRPVYELVLTPRTDGTLVRRIAIDLDSETSMPLRVRVDGANPDKPAVDIGFTSFSTATPAASLFDFTPPADAKVTRPKATTHDGTATKKSATAKPTSVEVGTGWATVTVTKLPADALKQLQAKPDAKTAAGATNPASMLSSLPQQSGAWGTGRVFEGTLVSAVLTNDGRLAVGAVPASALFGALASPAATALR